MKLVIQTSDSASNQVEAYFRKAIEKKELRPGERLPSNQALAERFKVSTTVIQNALSRLSRDGLLERKRKAGTFVRKFQERANIALLFGDSLADETAHYYRALLRRLNEGCGSRKWACRHWGGLNAEMFPAEEVGRRSEQILRDHQGHPFSGVLEYSPGSRSVIPAGMRKEVPGVSYGHNPAEVEFNASSYSFGQEAARHLASLGCRKLFYFCTHWHSRLFTESIDGLLDGAQQHGLPAPTIHMEPYAVQGYEMEAAMHQRMQALIAGWKKTGMPDGLVVNDDVAMRAVAPALLAAGLRIPAKMKVFCEGNEDVRFHYGFPVTRYEISPKAVAAFLLDALERKMNGEPVVPAAPCALRNTFYENM